MNSPRRPSKPKSQRASARTITPSAPSASVLPSIYGWGNNGYQGADYSRLRGYVYFPTLDTRKQLTSYTRTELLRRVRGLYVNVGLVRRLINGMARMVVGTGLDVLPLTTDKDWNAANAARFRDRASSRFAWDVGGRYNFWKSQLAVKRWQFRDGDCGAALTESQARLAMFAFYEAHQIGNGQLRAGDEKFWNDGVRTDRNNRPVAYRLLGDEQAQTDISADDFIFFADYESGGQVRASSVLGHAINKLVDSGEILAAITTGIKQFNQMGYAIETDLGGNATDGAESSFGPRTRVEVDADGNKVTHEAIYSGGGAVPRLAPGQKLRQLLDQRPHPNNLEFLDYLVRDIAWGAGLSPEVIWNIAALGGANTRFIQADTQGWIEEQQQELIDLYLARAYLYDTAKAMKQGVLPRCKDPQWWKHGWLPPPRLTVDYGREGKLHIEQLKMGMLTLSKFYGWQGLDAKEEINTWLDEIADMKAGLNEEFARRRTATDRNLTWDDIQAFRNSVGSRVNPAGGTADDGLPIGEAPARAALAALAKDPAKCAALIERLSNQPLED